VVSLHPHAAARYRQRVAEIHEALSRGNAASVEAIELVRELIGEIRVIPQSKGEPVVLEIAGDLAALMSPERSVLARYGLRPCRPTGVDHFAPAIASEANSRKRRLRKVKGRQQACIGWGNLVTLGMFLRLPL
jgi:hypothetical protein